jgi:GNAT superfamily N-acetyltransferase
VQIRPAAPEELALVGELTLAAYVADGFLTPDDEYAAELRAADQRAAQADLVVAAAPGGALLGTVTFALPGSPWAEVSRPGEAEFRMLAVAPEARGHGVGAALTQWCVDRAREQGCTAVALSSLTSMASAHRIYERMGFVRAPERDWWPSEETQLIVYLLELS